MGGVLKALLRFGRLVLDRIETLVEQVSDDPLVQRGLEADLGLPPGALDKAKAKRPELSGIDEYINDVNPSVEKILVAFDAIDAYVGFWRNVFQAARTEDSSLVVDELVYRLFQITTVELIKFDYPRLYAWMRFLGVIQQDLRLTLEEVFAPEVPANIFTAEYFEAWKAVFERNYLRFRLEQAADIVEEPDAGLPASQRIRQRQLGFDVFGFSDLFLGVPIVVLVILKERLERALHVKIEFFYGWELPPHPQPLPCPTPQPGGTIPLSEHIASRGSTLRISVPAGLAESASATLTQFLLADADGRLGWLLSLRGAVTFTGQAGSKERPLNVTGRIDARDGLDVILRLSGDDRFSFTDFTDPPSAGMRVAIEPAQTSARSRVFSIPETTGTRLEIGEFSFSVDVSADGLKVKAVVRKSAFVITPAEADAFIEEALGSKETRIEFDIGAAVDSENGFYLEGGSRLATTIAVNKAAGPVKVQSVQLSLHPHSSANGSELRFAALTSLRFTLGFLQISVEQIGFTLDAGSSSGPAPEDSLQLLSSLLYLRNPGFRPPSGIGILVDSCAATGGGFLFHDAENEQYAGAFQLEICQRVSVKAVGLLTTRLPDGRKGFSLLIIASAEFDPPLGPILGVSLFGVGVLVGIHRTLDADALRDGLRNRVLDAILFPEDPVANAGRVVNAVGSVFPAARGRYLVGISAKLGFGRPPIAILELAVVWEGGESPKWAVVGQLHVELPRGSPTKILELHVDGAGIWDLDRGEFSLDARLYDSHLAFATFNGDVALRTRKGDDSYFLFSAGGYHPEFAVPAGFPTLERIRFSLVDTEHARLYLTGYVAITSNTRQVGAEVGLFLKGGPISLECVLSFDALFDDDVGFVIDFDLEVKIKFKGRTLFGIDVYGRFTGPEPKHVVAELSIDLFLFSIGWSFDRTWGRELPPSELPQVDPLPELIAALQDTRNWSAELPSRGRTLVTLRKRPDSGQVLVHPLSGVEVRQGVVPLGIRIDRFAGNAVPGGQRFDITGVAIGGRPVPELQMLDELFAAADYLQLTDDEKLTRPSFEALPAGVALQPEGITFGGQRPETATHPAVSEMDFEEVIFGAGGGEVRSPATGTVSGRAATLAAAFGPAARSPLRITGLGRFQAPPTGPRLHRGGYVVARMDNLRMVRIDGAAAAQSFTAARQALERHRVANPRTARALQVVPTFEAGEAP